MNADTRIMCFRHCSSVSIFCRIIPELCPLCNSDLLNQSLEPFLVPYPLTNAVETPTTVVIIPSNGNFLDNYDNTSDLHIGIVNSHGTVYEFDKSGLTIGNFEKWTRCCSLPSVLSSWKTHWDEILSSMTLDNTKWNSMNYNVATMNCFNFVMEFFNTLNYVDLKFQSKEELCEKLILPKIQCVYKYVTLYRILKVDKFYISE